MIVAGEPSGDLHASHVVQALKAQHREISLYGMGGDMMDAAGVSLDIHIRDSAIMGITEVFAVLPKFLKKQALLKKRIRQQPPDASSPCGFCGIQHAFGKICLRARYSGSLLYST